MKVIGIDVGGTKTRGIVFDGSKTVKSLMIDTPRSKGKFFIELSELIKDLSGDKTYRIGIGLPGIVDQKTGKIINLPNLPFLNGVNIKSFLSKFTKIVYVDNDLKCMLTAEVKLGAAKKVKNAFMVAVGTGIGGAVLIDGRVYYGSGLAGEIGHMIIAPGKTVEDLAGGKKLKNFSRKELSHLSINLGIGLANVVNLLSPEAIIVGGGSIEKSGNIILPIMKREMQKYLVDPRARQTKIVTAKLKPLGGAIGAALLAAMI